jgi:ABC-type nitrate/sulfonate/bicarbonate transport system substrate-binding protein
MRRIVILVLAGVFAAGCAAQPPVSPTATRKSGSIRYFHILGPDIRYVPTLMALDDLQAQGYAIERTELSSSPLIVAALTRGDADIGSLDPLTMWTAITKGADVRSFLMGLPSPISVLARPGIKSCGDLDGGRVAVFSSTGLYPSLLADYIQRNCPNAKFASPIIADANGRSAALDSGQVDASELSFDTVLNLERKEPGKFTHLVDFSNEYPNLLLSVLNVRTAWAKQNPEILKDFITAVLNAQRRVSAQPQVLYDESVKRLNMDPATAKSTGDAWLKLGIWDPNGGLTSQNIQYTLDFLKGMNALPATLKVYDIADLTYLDAVLNKIGRK